MLEKGRAVASEAVKLTRSPLGIIGLFLVLVDAIAALVIVSSHLLPEQNSFIVGFIILFPCIVLYVFYILVTQHNHKLYSPSDFSDESNFVKTLKYNFSLKKSVTVQAEDNIQELSLSKNVVDSKIALEEMQTISLTLDNIVKMQESMLSLIEQKAPEIDVTSISRLKEDIEESISERLPSVVKKRMLTIYDVMVNNIPGCESLVEELDNKGYSAKVYFGVIDHRPHNAKDCKAIWVGENVPVSIAVEVIRISKQHFPFLTYIDLSGNSGEPDEVHDSIFIGGATLTAIGDELKKWSREDFEILDANMTQVDFHNFIRQQNSLTA